MSRQENGPRTDPAFNPYAAPRPHRAGTRPLTAGVIFSAGRRWANLGHARPDRRRPAALCRLRRHLRSDAAVRVHTAVALGDADLHFHRVLLRWDRDGGSFRAALVSGPAFYLLMLGVMVVWTGASRKAAALRPALREARY